MSARLNLQYRCIFRVWLLPATIFLCVGCALNLAVVMVSARKTSHTPTPISTPTPILDESLSQEVRKFLDDPEELKRLTDLSANTGLQVEAAHSLFCSHTSYARWFAKEGLGFRSKAFANIRFGVPFRSMKYSRFEWHSPAAFHSYRVKRLPGWSGGWSRRNGFATETSWPDQFIFEHVYPLSVLPFGFFANTIFYAIIIFLLFLALGGFRGRIRLYRKLCPQCAYPIGVSTFCTECGKTLSKLTHSSH